MFQELATAAAAAAAVVGPAVLALAVVAVVVAAVARRALPRCPAPRSDLPRPPIVQLRALGSCRKIFRHVPPAPRDRAALRIVQAISIVPALAIGRAPRVAPQSPIDRRLAPEPSTGRGPRVPVSATGPVRATAPVLAIDQAPEVAPASRTDQASVAGPALVAVPIDPAREIVPASVCDLIAQASAIDPVSVIDLTDLAAVDRIVLVIDLASVDRIAPARVIGLRFRIVPRDIAIGVTAGGTTATGTVGTILGIAVGTAADGT